MEFNLNYSFYTSQDTFFPSFPIFFFLSHFAFSNTFTENLVSGSIFSLKRHPLPAGDCQQVHPGQLKEMGPPTRLVSWRCCLGSGNRKKEDPKCKTAGRLDWGVKMARWGLGRSLSSADGRLYPQLLSLK